MSQYKVLYEDEHLLAADKPRGILTVAAKSGQKNFLDEVSWKYKKQNIRLRPLHRLDRGTSGIVLFAKTKQCFTEAIENKKISDAKKTYLLVTLGVPKEKFGEITFALPSRRDKNIKIKAKTRYKVLKGLRFKSITGALVEAQISSGRFHQIRSHMSMIDHPLLMDREYMDRDKLIDLQKIVKFRNFFLHASKIEFNHFITGEPMVIKCPPPDDFKKTFNI